MQNQIESAIALYSSGQPQKALDLIMPLLQDKPKEAILHNICGACYSALGNLKDAINSFNKALLIKPDYAEVHNSLGLLLQKTGQLNEAAESFKNAIDSYADYAEAHNNLGNAFKELNQLDAAIACYEKSIVINPSFASGYFNLGLLYFDQREFTKAIDSYEKAIQINPKYFEAHNNLGTTLQFFGKMNLAVKSYKKAIKIQPSFLDAQINLGVALTELGKLSEAKSCLRKAISIDSNSAMAHNGLGNVLKDQGNFEEAEFCFKQAINLNPDFSVAHQNLGIILYANGKLDDSLDSLQKAYSIDPNSKLLISVLSAKRSLNKSNQANTPNIIASDRLSKNPLILNREVEDELLDTLYEMKSIELDEVRDPGYGNAKGSDIRKSLFEDNRPIIKSIERDLVKIIKDEINADIYIDESWFVILGAGGGLNSHNHLSYLDKDSTLNLANQKYSLVYYISPGDQECSEPGLLRLYEPRDDVLPSKGMVLIFPADRPHSVIYNGTKDRVIIGINFYSL